MTKAEAIQEANEHREKLLDGDSQITFGKYKGTKLSIVPASYLLWIYENGKCTPAVRDYIKRNLKTIENKVEEVNNNIKNAKRKCYYCVNHSFVSYGFKKSQNYCDLFSKRVKWNTPAGDEYELHN